MRREVETGEGIFDRKAVSAAVQFVRERCRWEDHDRYEREIPHGNSLAFACLVSTNVLYVLQLIPH